MEISEVVSGVVDGPGMKDLDLIGHVQVSLVAELGESEMTVEELFKLRKQDVVTLKQTLDAPVTLLLNGKAIARGELLAVDEHLGVRITELL
jgi:flagellar motor switch protein FliN/FliY